MSVHSMSWAWRVRGLKPGARLVLLALADHSDDKGYCWPGQDGIANKCEMGQRTVVRHINELLEAGLITRQRRNKSGAGFRQSNGYYLHLDQPLWTDGQADPQKPKCQNGTLASPEPKCQNGTLASPEPKCQNGTLALNEDNKENQQLTEPKCQNGTLASQKAYVPKWHLGDVEKSKAYEKAKVPNWHIETSVRSEPSDKDKDIGRPAEKTPPHKAPPQTTIASEADRFEAWWKAYPLKVKKKDARRIWDKRNLNTLADRLIADAQTRLAQHRPWIEGYIPHPTTYLNGDRWEDAIEPVATKPTNKTGVNGNAKGQRPLTPAQANELAWEQYEQQKHHPQPQPDCIEAEWQRHH